MKIEVRLSVISGELETHRAARYKDDTYPATGQIASIARELIEALELPDPNVPPKRK